MNPLGIKKSCYDPVDIYLLAANTRIKCEIRSKLTIKTRRTSGHTYLNKLKAFSYNFVKRRNTSTKFEIY